MSDRDDYLRQCKDAAMVYALRGDLNDAVTSMLSDLSKHHHDVSGALIVLGMMYASDHDQAGVISWIEGFR